MNLQSLFIKIAKISSPSGKEEQMSIYLQKWLTKNQFKYKVDSVGNLYAKNNTPGEPLLLCAHMDTVQPGENIKPRVVKGIIKSSGNTILGADNKVAIAAIIDAVEKTNNVKPLELLFTVKEETGGGIDHFPFNWINAKKALIFDSAKPLGGIIMSSPSIINFTIQFLGKASHSSTPDKGINAFTPAIKTLSQIKTGVLDNGDTTINIGVINGGTGINTVPGEIVIQGELRSYNKSLFTKHMEEIKNIVNTQAKKYKTTSNVEFGGYCSGYTHNKNGEFIYNISQMYSNCGLDTVLHYKSGVSDANVLNEKGIETLNLTDAVNYPHTIDEQISVFDLDKLGEVIKKCITDL